MRPGRGLGVGLVYREGACCSETWGRFRLSLPWGDIVGGSGSTSFHSLPDLDGAAGAGACTPVASCCSRRGTVRVLAASLHAQRRLRPIGVVLMHFGAGSSS